MTEENFRDTNPADYWPEAEKMIDNHFKAKRKKRALILCFAGLFLVGSLTGSYYYFNHAKHETKTVVASSNENQSLTPLNTQRNQDLDTNINPPTTSSTNTEKSNISLPIEKTIPETQKPNNPTPEKQISKNATIGTPNNPKFPGRTPSPIESEALLNHSRPNTHPTLPTPKAENHGDETESSQSTSVTNISATNQEAVLLGNIRKSLPQKHSELTPFENVPVAKTKTKFDAEWRLDVTTGLNYISKSLSSTAESYTRRTNEEANIITPALTVSVTRLWENFEVRVGLGLQIAGEKLNYSALSRQLFAIDSSYWYTYYHTVFQTDTNFVYGYVYYSQQSYQRLDSVIITQTDTVRMTTTDAAISSHNKTNQLYYTQLPIQFTWIFSKGKFRTGISAGITPMLLTVKNGYYIKDDMSGLESFSEIKSFRKLIWSAQAGIDIRYMISPKTHLLLRPGYSIMLNSVFGDEKSTKQKYSAAGVQAGISFLIK